MKNNKGKIQKKSYNQSSVEKPYNRYTILYKIALIFQLFLEFVRVHHPLGTGKKLAQLKNLLVLKRDENVDTTTQPAVQEGTAKEAKAAMMESVVRVQVGDGKIMMKL